MTELLDIVNHDDEVIGQLDKDEVYRQGLRFRVINAFLLNPDHEIWVPRRAAHKKLFPLCLDASVGGHVSAGESYLTAFEREVQEEIGFMPGTYTFKAIGKLTPSDHGVSAFTMLYSITSDQTPSYSAQDFIEAQWMSVAQLLQLIEQGTPAKGDLPVLARTLQYYLDKK